MTRTTIVRAGWTAVLAASLVSAGCSSNGDKPAAGCPPCGAGTVCDETSKKCVPTTPPAACPAECPSGQTCDPVTKQCVAKPPPPEECPPTCPDGMVCDPSTKKCVSTQQGACPGPCGANAICDATSKCICNAGHADCDSDMGQPSTNGCECEGKCTDAKCGGKVVGECDPYILNDCGTATRYCEIDTCAGCPAGKYNCDGTEGCESDTACGAGGCDIFPPDTCASQDEYCDETTKKCTPCPTGKTNCNRALGDCECPLGCDGNNCKKQCTEATGCGNVDQYCDIGFCVACPAGRQNCNGISGCECQGTCNGTTCNGTELCDYLGVDGCGDQAQWCFENTCYECGDSLNCNGTKGCECDKAGCNGTQCAGKCVNFECKP